MSYYGYGRRSRLPKPEHLTGAPLRQRIVTLSENAHVDNWTRDFCTSILDGFDKYKGLTQGQYDVFAKKEQQFSVEAIDESRQWQKTYAADQQKKDNALICANYYKANPPYFADLAEKIIEDPTFVPTAKQYRSMCENKYARKVIESTTVAPKYPVGMVVEVRKPFQGYHLQAHFSAASLWRAVVIASDASPVISAAAGSKRYTLLPFAAANTVQLEERQIKKARKVA